MLQTIETTRLILSPRTMEHFEECVKMDIDRFVTKYIPGVWDGSCEHRENLKNRITKSYPNGLGYWSIFSKDNPDTFLGWIHLLPDQDNVEIGFRLIFDAWGNGYATEASMAILEYAFETLGYQKVIAYTHADNKRSKGLMERLGFRHIADFMYKDETLSSAYEITNKNDIKNKNC